MMGDIRILVVDDDPALLEALPEAVRFRMPGIEVDTCDSAAAAVERIEASDYDAIVTDIKMPGMDGLALLSIIRRKRPATPTLLITGHGEDELGVQALEGGALEYISKPIDRDSFIASLERAILTRHGRRAPEIVSPSGKGPAHRERESTGADVVVSPSAPIRGSAVWEGRDR